MKRFLIIIGPRKAPRIALDVMARSSCEAFEQHVCLVQPGERMDIRSFP